MLPPVESGDQLEQTPDNRSEMECSRTLSARDDSDGGGNVPLTDADDVVQAKLVELGGFTFPIAEQPEDDPTGKRAYCSACEAIHKQSYMKFPISNVIEQMGDSVLCLDYVGLGDKGSVALAAALCVNTSVAELSLIGNWISSVGAEAITKAIVEARRITKLDFSENKLGLPVSAGGKTAGAVIAELLGRGSRITSLSLRDNSLGNRDVAAFADTLVENNVLQVLDLSYNSIGYRGAVDLARVVANNGDLLEINLQWNQLLPTGCLALLSDGFLLNNTIKRFNLSWTGMDDECAALVGRIISENATEEIIIAHNRITRVGAEAIARGLRSTSALVTLILDDNPLHDAGCCALIRSLEFTSTMRTLGLRQTGSGTDATAERGRILSLNANAAVTLTDDIVPGTASMGRGDSRDAAAVASR